MKAQEIIVRLEQDFPLYYAASWDNPGLLAGRREKEVKTVYVALDVTDEVVEEAVRLGADLLLTHHPLIFNKIQKVNEDDLVGRRIVKLIQNDISYYAMHTNYDVVRMGQLASDMLGLKSEKVLMQTWSDPDGDREEGYGRVGMLKREMTLEACAQLVKSRFSLPNVRVFGELDRKVRRAAISPGSGKGMKEPAFAVHAEVLITGDIDHHEGIDAAGDGLSVIDAGHYGLEHIFIQNVKEYVESNWKTLEVHSAGIRQPFTII